MSTAAAAWAGSIAAIIMCAFAIGALLIRIGRLLELLERVVDELGDHEDRLRGLELGVEFSGRDAGRRAVRRARPL